MSYPIKPNPIPEYLKNLPGRTLVTVDEIVPWFNFSGRSSVHGTADQGYFPKPDGGKHRINRGIGVPKAEVSRWHLSTLIKEWKRRMSFYEGESNG